MKKIFDLCARQKALKRTSIEGLFLHDLSLNDIHERLQDINRTFTKKAIITSFPQKWAPHYNDSDIFAPDEYLKLTEKHYDLVLHIFALHAMNDPLGQLIQCQRALIPDGLFIAVTLGGKTLSKLRNALLVAETNIFGGASPRIFPMADIRDYGALLQRAHLALGVADAYSIKVAYQNLNALMRDLRAMGESNCLYERIKTFTPHILFKKAEEVYIRSSDSTSRNVETTAMMKNYSTTLHQKNGIIGEFEIITLTGWAPAPSQPQPLKPGSAMMHLSDALAEAKKHERDKN